jgi:hypothetical protein
MRNQRGSALIGVMAIVLIVSLMGAAYFSITSVDTQERQIQSAWVNAFALTQGAIEATVGAKKKNPNEHNTKKICLDENLPEGCEYCESNPCTWDDSIGLTVCIKCSVQIDSKGGKIGPRITAIIPP